MDRPIISIPIRDSSESPIEPASVMTPDETPPRKNSPVPWLNILLFALTVLSTLTAGALQRGVNIFENPAGLIRGIPFSFTLMAILLTHEMGHYLASRYHRVQASLPYFIPAPPGTFIIGTFGAFIRMTSPITNKRALLDIGASGPIAGFIVAVAAVAVGLYRSEVIPVESLAGLKLGSPLIFSGIAELIIGAVPENHDVLLHPIAFAGWIGLFVTALNLIPIGQLDGGHIVYAILGERHRMISFFMMAVLAVIGIFGWPGWLLWAVLPVMFGIRHPPLLDTTVPMDSRRRTIGWISLAIFMLCFTPTPFII